MTRPQDLYPYERNARACILRIGTVAVVGASKLDVDVPGGGRLTGVAQLAGFTATVGARVAVLLDRDSALAIGLVK
jgi:hypothetical protein